MVAVSLKKKAAFGMDAKGYYEQFDLNDDGKVDSGDMGQIFANWGVTADMVTFDPTDPPPPAQVREPANPNEDEWELGLNVLHECRNQLQRPDSLS